MATCKICGIHIGEDHRRRYCDQHREWRDGEWRKKGWLRKYHQEKKQKYSMRQTRVSGRTGFSEHMCFNNKTMKPDLIKERIRVRKEKRRVLGK